MKKLVRKDDDAIWYPSDVAHIKKVLNRNGYDASDHDIAWAWQEHSTSYCASWLILDGYADDDIVFYMLQYLKEEPSIEDYFYA